MPHFSTQVISQRVYPLHILFLFQVQFQVIIKQILSVIRQTVYPQVILAGILLCFQLINQVWIPIIFHHQYLYFSQVVFRSHPQVSCHIISPQTLHESSHHNYLNLILIIFLNHFQVSFHITFLRPYKNQAIFILIPSTGPSIFPTHQPSAKSSHLQSFHPSEILTYVPSVDNIKYTTVVPSLVTLNVAFLIPHYVTSGTQIKHLTVVPSLVPV